MATTTDSSSRKAAALRSTKRAPVTSSRVAPEVSDPRVKLEVEAVTGLHERRRRRRAQVPPMYTLAVVRVLGQKGEPMEGHVVDLSETGMAVELDNMIPVGQGVTVEFRVTGLGRIVKDEWSEFVAAALVVRHDELDDFPGGPYKTALRFVRIGTIAQAQIARFVATQPG